MLIQNKAKKIAVKKDQTQALMEAYRDVCSMLVLPNTPTITDPVETSFKITEAPVPEATQTTNADLLVGDSKIDDSFDAFANLPVGGDETKVSETTQDTTSSEVESVAKENDLYAFDETNIFNVAPLEMDKVAPASPIPESDAPIVGTETTEPTTMEEQKEAAEATNSEPYDADAIDARNMELAKKIYDLFDDISVKVAMLTAYEAELKENHEKQKAHKDIPTFDIERINTVSEGIKSFDGMFADSDNVKTK